MSTRKKTRRPSLKGSLNPSKRHRDRVNVELDNLAKLLPFAPEVIAKLDKLSVLRLSASYLRTKNFFKGLNIDSKPSDSPMPDDFEKTGAISDLLLEALDGFLMVLTQDVEVFYASETISDFLGVSQASVIHQDFLRFVHVDDQDMLENNLKKVPSPPEQKIREITDDNTPAETSDSESAENEGEISKERSFVCRFKCILNTNAGFFKPFKCHGRLREVDVPDSSIPQLALFLICSPLEVTTSIVEVRMKSMLFCTKNKLDLTFVDIDQKGKQIVGYTKKDILAQSSYCMMHYDDIPVLQKMHQDLMATGKCEGIFRWLNKHNKWQWLSGTGQVIFKNNRPDFVITTNKPLSDEEGDEEVRRRERDLGIVPTSPASLLGLLQIASPPPSVSRVGGPSDLHQPQMPQYPQGPSASPSLASPNLSTTSCTSDPFPPEDLPLDLNTDFLFEAEDGNWDAQDSLSDLENIGKSDLVNDLFEIDMNLHPLDDSNTVPLTHASDPPYPPAETLPNPPMSQPHAWMPRDQGITAQYPHGQRQPVSSSGMMTSTYDSHRRPHVPPTGRVPPPGVSSTRIVSPQGISQGVVSSGMVSPPRVQPGVMSQGVAPPGVSSTRIVSPQGISQGVVSSGMVSPPRVQPGVMSQGVPPAIVPSQNMPRNGIPANRQFVNPPDPSGYRATMTVPQALPPRGNMGSNQGGLLQVQTQQMPNRSYIKTEPAHIRSAGYYCNSANMDSTLPGNGPSIAAVSTQANQYRYNKLNHMGVPQWTTELPSPYSSGSSSTSSYDALHVQFSPTDILTSPFASPHDDCDYNHGNAQPPVSLPGQPYTNGGYTKRPLTRPPPNFPQPFVDIPEIAPMGVVEELVPGMHRTSPMATRTTAGLTHL